MNMWTVLIKDQTSCYVQSDLVLHYTKLLMLSTVRKELTHKSIDTQFDASTTDSF